MAVSAVLLIMRQTVEQTPTTKKHDDYTVPSRLIVAPAGRLRGALTAGAHITWNNPFPTHNGFFGSSAMMGVVMHTEVGFDHNVVEEFNTPAAQASAHFSIDMAGNLHQYGPIGKGWCAWAQMAGNLAWYSIEHEDHGNPNTPLSDPQMWTSAQVVECLAAFAGFPLQLSNDINTKGYGVHFMGGGAWGGHTCPDLPPQHVRSAQRPEILRRAKLIRAGSTVKR